MSKIKIKALIEEFEEKAPETVFEWQDSQTDAEGWVVINSLRGGAAGGGTRMRLGLDRREVESLAKTMEIKFSVSGPNIGGAKSGINFDPKDPRKSDVLRRWFKAVQPLLKNYYGTGGDLNVDELDEVIPMTEENGLWHPQEGVVNGHLNSKDSNKIKILGQLRYGVSKVIEDKRFTPDVSQKYTIADMVTGYGVCESIRHFYSIWGGQLEGKKVIIQGWGNVGCGAAFYLSQAGAKIVGILDIKGGVLNSEGFTHSEIVDLIVNRDGNQFSCDVSLSSTAVGDSIWDIGAEVFVPAAASRLVESSHINRMARAGLELISCGANVPFNDSEIFYGAIAEEADAKVAVIPDFIANCGMARIFANLMEIDAEITDPALFRDVSEKIYKSLESIHRVNNSHTGITLAAFGVSLAAIM